MNNNCVDCWKVVKGGLVKTSVRTWMAVYADRHLYFSLDSARTRAGTWKKDRYKLVDGKPLLLWYAGGRLPYPEWREGVGA